MPVRAVTTSDRMMPRRLTRRPSAIPAIWTVLTLCGRNARRALLRAPAAVDGWPVSGETFRRHFAPHSRLSCRDHRQEVVQQRGLVSDRFALLAGCVAGEQPSRFPSGTGRRAMVSAAGLSRYTVRTIRGSSASPTR